MLLATSVDTLVIYAIRCVLNALRICASRVCHAHTDTHLRLWEPVCVAYCVLCAKGTIQSPCGWLFASRIAYCAPHSAERAVRGGCVRASRIAYRVLRIRGSSNGNACGSRFALRIVYRAQRSHYRVSVGGCLHGVLRIVRQATLMVLSVGASARCVLRIAYCVLGEAENCVYST